MKVLHLVRSLKVGGLEKVVVDLTHGLAQHNVQSHLGCLIEAGDWAEQVQVEGTWIGGLGNSGPLAVLRSLCAYIREHKIDVIHTHNSHPHKYGVPASILTRTPLVHTKHGRNWPDNPKWVWFSRQLSRFTKVIVPVSKDIERIVVEVEGVPQQKVVTILNGVVAGREIDRTQPSPCVASVLVALRRDKTAGSLILRQDDGESKYVERREGGSSCPRPRLGIPENAFVVGSVGRFSAEKRYALLVKAFAEFHRQVPESFLVLVGDGPDRQAIEQTMRETDSEDCVLLPGVQTNVSDWLGAMDVFCLSSDQEGTSVTLLEAGAAGLPSVVTNVGGNGEIVSDGETGIVVPPEDAGSLTDAFVRFAGDVELRGRMGAAARERVAERYSLDVMVSQYMDIYRHV